jgi:predicted RNase H-like nuclease (RuvC/YqgF family)
MDVTAQITDSLKLALKEKAAEEELYQNLSHRLGTETVESICDKYQSVTREYNEVKMDSVELERQIRSMAQRCLKAEEVAREGLNTARQIEDLSGKIGAQSRLIDQLTERIQRLSERREISPISRPAPPSSLQVTTLTSNQASVCLTLKSLIGLDHL